ncbi:MAG: biotin-dependent carboxyltransferase family protein [Hyphomicrobiaceae bacterium]
MRRIVVLSCGPATSVQDRGRIGYRRMGLARAGAMDQRALAAVNALVGNPPDAAAIEMAFVGGRLAVLGASARLAVAGGVAHLSVDGQARRMNTSFIVEAGATLTIGRAERGSYVMVGAEGGIDVPPLMGSRSCDVRAGFDGVLGRRLVAGDVLPLAPAPSVGRMELECPPVSLDPDAPIRIVLGPHESHFGAPGIDRLLGSSYTVSHHVDRMAYKLDGPAIGAMSTTDLVSQPILPGAIQVPPDGAPLVLMADAQTIGGYPRIATVIAADLNRLAQKWPGEPVRFLAIGAEEAQAIARAEAAASVAVRDVSCPEAAGANAAGALDGVQDAMVDAFDPAMWELTR